MKNNHKQKYAARLLIKLANAFTGALPNEVTSPVVPRDVTACIGNIVGEVPTERGRGVTVRRSKQAITPGRAEPCRQTTPGRAWREVPGVLICVNNAH